MVKAMQLGAGLLGRGWMGWATFDLVGGFVSSRI